LRKYNEIERTYHSNESEINQIKLSDNNKYLAACDDSGNIQIYDINNNNVFNTLSNGHTNICSTISFRPTREWEIFSGGFDCNIIQWQIQNGEQINIYNNQREEESNKIINPPFVHHIDISVDGKYLVAALGDGTVVVYSVLKKCVIFKLNHHNASVSQVLFPTFAPSTHILSSGNDRKINLYKVTYPTEIKKPQSSKKRNKNKKGKKNNPTQDQLNIEQPQNPNSLPNENLISILHPHKVNWMVTNDYDYKFYIADESNIISYFTICN